MENTLSAIIQVHKAFGAPGNYGYGHPEGEALAHLYNCTRSLAETIEKSKTDRTARYAIALEESLKLQGHYAELLNQYDGGERMIFKTIKEWIERLKKTGVLSNAG